MNDIKYYVLGTKNNKMLLEYLDKFYNKLISDLKEIKSKGYLEITISNLLNNNGNKDFVLNPDNSSVINYIYRELVLGHNQNIKEISYFLNIFEKQVEIFLEEGIDSINLEMNKGNNILNTEIKLTHLDNNPYSGLEAHPEHIEYGAMSGNWGEKTQKEWIDVYTKTFELLKKVDKGFYDELNLIIKKIIPLGTSRGVHNSASYKECIGHLYLGYTIDIGQPEIANLEAIIHESSHNKLNLILQFDSLILNTKEEKYYSAIRPDARPIHGILLGYHAFAPTMYILMKSYYEGHLGKSEHWEEKITLYYMKTKFLQKIFNKYAILTPLGKEILKEMDYVVSLMDDLIKKINPSKDIINRAKVRQQQHFSEVNSRYSYLEY